MGAARQRLRVRGWGGVAALTRQTGAVLGPGEEPAGYNEWAPSRPLRRYVACAWTSVRAPVFEPASPVQPVSEPVLPDGGMDIIWNGTRLFVAGPDTAPSWTDAGGAFAVGLRFRPGMAPLFLDTSACETRDQRLDLELFWADAEAVGQELAECSSLRRAATVLERRVASLLGGIREPDPAVETAAALWAAGGGAAPTAELARRAGLSERQLHRRFLPAVGYGPKLLQRILRFQAFLSASRDPRASLAHLAARVGYADQAHLTRETRALAALTPARLRAARTEVRIVQDAGARDRYNSRMTPDRGIS